MKTSRIDKHPWENIFEFILKVRDLLMALHSGGKLIRSVVVHYHDDNDNGEIVETVFIEKLPRSQKKIKIEHRHENNAQSQTTSYLC